MRCILLAALAVSPAVAAAQDADPADASHTVLASPDRVEWKDAPPALRAGAKVAVLEGDPAEAGPFTMRIKLPDRYRIPPHYHPVTEHVTVLQGTFRVGMGEKFDATAMKPLKVGGFAAMAPGVRHFAEAKGETILQLHGVGPWGLIYVDPADDPRGATP